MFIKIKMLNENKMQRSKIEAETRALQISRNYVLFLLNTFRQENYFDNFKDLPSLSMFILAIYLAIVNQALTFMQGSNILLQHASGNFSYQLTN